MTFPYYVHIGPLTMHPHFLAEGLAYLVGFRLYVRLRARADDHLANLQRLWVVAAAIAGAVFGSKLLYWMVDPGMTARNWHNLDYMVGGKTIVGALIGGLIAVEWAKRRMGITRSTGDLFAIPLTIGIMIGRVGCFLTGLSDHTYGLPTNLPWGVDFGDGIPRHPTQLYEMLWLGMLALWLLWLRGRPHHEGDLFRGFMIGYMGFRLAIEFIKPGVPLAGLTAIQWACLGTLVYYGWTLRSASRLQEARANG